MDQRRQHSATIIAFKLHHRDTVPPTVPVFYVQASMVYQFQSICDGVSRQSHRGQRLGGQAYRDFTVGGIAPRRAVIHGT